MSGCSAIDLDEIRRSSKITSWICLINFGMVTVLSRLKRAAPQVETSTRLKCSRQFLMVAYDGACSINVSDKMARISFGVFPCRKKLTFRCCWNRARRLTCFLSASVTRRDLQFGTWTDTSFQQHYRFRPTTSGSKLGRRFISTPSYHDIGSIMWYMFQMMTDWSAGWSDVKTALRRLKKVWTCIIHWGQTYRK